MTDVATRGHVVLVHGAWMNGTSWDGWVERLHARGYTVHAPSWPHDDAPVARLRAESPPGLASVGVAEIVAHYEAVVRGLPAPPILVGHSFGGLFVQMLADRGLGSAVVALHPAPPKGVMPEWNALRAGFPVLASWNPGGRVHTMGFEAFHWGWAHTVDEAEARGWWERTCVPTPGRVYVQAALAPFTDTLAVDFTNRTRAPLLIVAGGQDRTVTAGMNRRNHALQARSGAVTELRVFDDRPHGTCFLPGWEAVCDTAIGWAEEQLGRGSPAA